MYGRPSEPGKPGGSRGLGAGTAGSRKERAGTAAGSRTGWRGCGQIPVFGLWSGVNYILSLAPLDPYSLSRESGAHRLWVRSSSVNHFPTDPRPTPHLGAHFPTPCVCAGGRSPEVPKRALRAGVYLLPGWD